MFDVSMTSKINLPFQSFCMCLVSFYRNELPYYFTLKKVSLKLNAITSVFRGHKATIGADGDEIYTEDSSLNMHFCKKKKLPKYGADGKEIYTEKTSLNMHFCTKNTPEIYSTWLRLHQNLKGYGCSNLCL